MSSAKPTRHLMYSSVSVMQCLQKLYTSEFVFLLTHPSNQNFSVGPATCLHHHPCPALSNLEEGGVWVRELSIFYWSPGFEDLLLEHFQTLGPFLATQPSEGLCLCLSVLINKESKART